MAKVVRANLKMRIRGGQATAAPPVGSTLGQYGVNMMDFINPFNRILLEPWKNIPFMKEEFTALHQREKWVRLVSIFKIRSKENCVRKKMIQLPLQNVFH